MDEELRPRRPKLYKVVHQRVAVRTTPNTSGELAGAKKLGDIVEVTSVENGWVRLRGLENHWMLIDGSAVGLGKLLEVVPPPEEPVSLVFLRPDDGEFMFTLQARMSTTVGEAKQRVCGATGLKERAMIIARGKMGQRIADSQENVYQDGETLYECGFCDGDEPGYMYLGDASQDLAGFVPAS